MLSTDHDRNLVSRTLNAPRSALVRLLGCTGRRRRVHFPHRTFRRDEVLSLVEDAGLSVERLETFRFHMTGAPATVQRLLNSIEGQLPAHRLGDIVWVEARA